MSYRRPPPKYRKHPKGLAFVEWGNRRHYLGKYGTDKSRAKYRRFLASIEEQEKAESVPMPIGPDRRVVELIVAYRSFCLGHYIDRGKPSKECRSIDDALRYYDEFAGDDRVDEYGPLRFLAFQQHLIERGFVRRSINAVMGRIRRFWRWCCKHELADPELYGRLGVVDNLKRGFTTAKEGRGVDPVPKEVVDATLPWLSPVVADMVRLQRLCGMRPGEVCRMKPRRIDRTDVVWLYRPKRHKNAWRGIERLIAIPPSAQPILEPYLARDPSAYCFSPRESERLRNREKPNRKTPIYPSERRRRERNKQLRLETAFTRLRHRYDTDSYRRAIRYAVTKAGRHGVKIPHWHPHQLRHSAADVIGDRYGRGAARLYLGHESEEATKRYSRRQIARLKKLALRVDRLLQPPQAERQLRATANRASGS